MSDQPTDPVVNNESNLLESAIHPDQGLNPNPPSSHSFDDIPIGGKKFQFSQYPQDGQVKPPPKKPIKPRASKPTKKIQPKNNQENEGDTEEKKQIQNTQNQPVKKSQNQSSTTGNAMVFDEMPIGGKKFDIPQFPEQSPKQPKKPVKPKPKKTQPVIKDEPISNEPKENLNPVPNEGGTFDEKPIGKGNFNISQFPEGDQAPVETNYTMSQKLKSKAVKLRQSGLEDLLQLIENDPDNPQILEAQMNKLLKETNPACLEKALYCFKAWIIKDKNWGDEEAKLSIESGFINGKPNTKKLTIEICDLMYDKKPDCVEMTILVGLKGKVPKNLAGYISITNQLLTIYGIKRMKFLKPYMNEIVTIINRQKLAAVKTQGTNILKQAYKWLTKEAVEPLLKDLKEGIKKELDTFWEGYDKTQVMKAPKDIEDEKMGSGPKKKIDAYELSESVDIFKKFNQRWSQAVLKEEKWNQKVKLMQDFVNNASVPKINHSTQHRHIVEMIKRLINHSNFNVVLWDLKILACLAKGIRRPFAHVVRTLFSNVIGKFRQKKTQMIDETFHTLNDFSYCISIEDVLEDVKEGLNDKVPNMKVNLINWIGKFVQQKIQEKDDLPDKARDALRNLFPIFEKLLTDSTAQVRNCMAKNIAKLKLMLGDHFFTPMENKMNKNITDKINDAKGKTNVKKVSKEKDPKNSTMNNTSTSKIENTSKMFDNASKVKTDLSEDITTLIPKMNHADWQKRKDAAEATINLLNDVEGKVHISCLHDLLATLKTRIADPNKQLIKTFVHLTGLIFGFMNEKEIKANAKNFICGLADGLSDKMEANKKQINLTLNKIGDYYGKQHLLSIMSFYLDSDKDSRVQVINLILENEEFIGKADTRDYPKGIIKCLSDRNREIRNLGEKLFERVSQKMGIDVFRNLTRNQKPALAKDLNTIFDKYDTNKNNTSTIVSKRNSPPHHKPQPPISAKKISQQKSLQKSILNQKSFDRDFEEQKPRKGGSFQSIPVLSKTVQQTYVEGDDNFAPLKVLSTQRVQRQQKDEKYPWICDYVKQSQEDQLSESINSLIKHELAKKMLSLDYRKALDAASQIIKFCKQIAFQNEIRQLYDILIKWVFLRLWGGNPAIQSIIEILPPVMSILEKKKLAINDNEVDLVISVLRQYFLSAYMNQYQVSQSLYTIIKCLIVLSSGERLLKKMLKQFNIELSSIHRQVKRQATVFYRDGLNRLIKAQLMEYIGNQDTLEEASNIKELKNDPEFLTMLYNRFHPNVLKCFGFKAPDHIVQKQQPIVHPPPPQQPRQSIINTQKNVIKQEQRMPSNPPVKPIVNTSNVAAKKEKQSLNDEIDLSVYTNPHPASPLGKHLSRLIPPNDATVSFFTHLLNQNGEKISNELITHAKVIFGSILKSIILMLDNRSDYPPEKIINQISLLQQAIKCKNIVSNLGELLYHGTKFTLTQLVFEDENKKFICEDLKNRGFYYEREQNPFIKAINGVMLRILENACPQEIVNILLGLLNANASSSNPSQKNIYLIIKCLTRVVTNYATSITERRTEEFLFLLNQYLNVICLEFPLEEFNPVGDKLKPEENVLKALKSILTQLVRYYGEEIWTYHANSISQADFKDDYIPSFLQFMGIPCPENVQTIKEDENLKLINQLLSKTKTFDSGILELKKYMAINSLFSPVQYFNSRGFDQRFIMMVMNALEGRTVKRTPTKRQLREEKSQNSRKNQKSSDNVNIQDKIKKLKMKFQQVQPKKQQQSRPGPMSSANTSNRQASREEPDRGEERALQIKRRIDQMKSRMNNNSRR